MVEYIIRDLLHDTTNPYKEVDYNGIEYSTCKDFEHISRYKRLRQVVHYLDDNKRFTTLEIQNSYSYKGVEVEYYTVPVDRENRLDLISFDYYGTSTYAWVISYINGLPDAYTVHEGQLLLIPVNISSLFGTNKILSAIPVSSLNLGTE